MQRFFGISHGLGTCVRAHESVTGKSDPLTVATTCSTCECITGKLDPLTVVHVQHLWVNDVDYGKSGRENLMFSLESHSRKSSRT